MSFLRSMLLNETYIGPLVYAATQERKFRVGGRIKRRKVAVSRDEQAVKIDAHERIVDDETWRRVQATFQARKGTRPLPAAAAVAAERQVASSRLRRLRDIVQMPNLDEVRSALRGVIVRIELGGEGGAFMRIGEGPLEPRPATAV